MSRVRDSQTPCKPGAAGHCTGVEHKQLKHIIPHKLRGDPTCNCMVSGSMLHSRTMVVMAAPSIATAKNLQVDVSVKAGAHVDSLAAANAGHCMARAPT